MRHFLLTCLLLIGIFAFPQKYEIKITVDGLRDTSLYLAYYLGDKKYVVDTCRLDKKSSGVFSGNKELEQGLYLIILPNKSFIDFAVSEDQFFSLKTDTTYLMMSLMVKGSEDCAAFSDYQKNVIYNQKRSSDLKRRLSFLKDKTDSVKIINAEIEKVRNEVMSFGNMIIRKYPKSFTASFIKATRDIDVPAPPKDSTGKITDSLFQYNYYRAHYFDNIDFGDERLIKTPLLKGKIEKYFSKTVIQRHDTIMREVTRVISLSERNKNMKRFVTATLLNYYESSRYMGMENIFVDIADKYYLSGNAEWADTVFLRKLNDKVMRMKPNLIGKVAPELKSLPTNTGEWATLSLVDARATLLIFWEPNCGHCKKVIPKVQSLYAKYKERGFFVMAFYTQHDTIAWNRYIEEHDLTGWLNVFDPYGFSDFRKKYDVFTTPTLYLLDENKKIAGRKVDVEVLDEMLKDLLK